MRVKIKISPIYDSFFSCGLALYLYRYTGEPIRIIWYDSTINKNKISNQQ